MLKRTNSDNKLTSQLYIIKTQFCLTWLFFYSDWQFQLSYFFFNLSKIFQRMKSKGGNAIFARLLINWTNHQGTKKKSVFLFQCVRRHRFFSISKGGLGGEWLNWPRVDQRRRPWPGEKSCHSGYRRTRSSWRHPCPRQRCRIRHARKVIRLILTRNEICSFDHGLF